jgi:hypothetical protein
MSVECAGTEPTIEQAIRMTNRGARSASRFPA